MKERSELKKSNGNKIKMANETRSWGRLEVRKERMKIKKINQKKNVKKLKKTKERKGKG